MEQPAFVLQELVGEFAKPFEVDIEALRAVPGVLMSHAGCTVVAYQGESVRHQIFKEKVVVRDSSLSHAEHMVGVMWPIYVRCMCDAKAAKAARKRVATARAREKDAYHEKKAREDHEREMLLFPYGHG